MKHAWLAPMATLAPLRNQGGPSRAAQSIRWPAEVDQACSEGAPQVSFTKFPMAPQRGLFFAKDGGASLCPVAAHIPEVQRGGNIHDDTQAKMRRDAYVRIVDGLWKEPQFIVEVGSYLDSLMQAKSPATKDVFSIGSVH